MIRVNFLAPGAGSRSRAWHRWLVVPPEQRAALAGLTMLAATVVGVGAWWWLIGREQRAIDAQAALAAVAVTRLQETAHRMEQAAERERDLNERLAVAERFRAAQRGPVALLDTISRSLADGLWLTELRQAGTTVQLDGRALSLAAFTDFIGRLQTSGHFARPMDIVATSTETVSEVPVVRFAIRGEVASLAPPPDDGPAIHGRPAVDPGGGVSRW